MPGSRPVVRMNALAAGGDGVGRLDDGRVVFAPRTAPGDLVELEIVRDLARRAHGEVVRLIEPGPGRRKPPCELAEQCGGCDWQHLDEPTQTRARQRAVRDALERLAGLRDLPVFEALPSPRALGYRARARVAQEQGRVGFRAPGSRRVVDVARCPVLDPPTQAALERLRSSRPLERLRASRGSGPEGRGEADLRGIGPELQVELPAGGRRRFRVPAGAFYQANGALWGGWLERVADLCGSGTSAVELYAGMGFYTVGLCEHFAQVVAVEASPAAREIAANVRANVPANIPPADVRANAHTDVRADAGANTHALAHLEVIRQPAERWARKHLRARAPELVLLNPPRTGCHSTVSDAIRDAPPRVLVYVSCDPATLARDLARIGDAFRVARVVVLDAFPQTHHSEVMIRAERRCS